MRKKIMIIGAGDFQVPLIEYAAEICDVIIVAPVVDDYLRKLASAVYISDVRNQEKILEIAENEKIDGVITDQTDIPVRTVAYVAEKMGLPGIGYEESKLYTDKARMSGKLEELGIRSIPSAQARTAEEAREFMDRIGSEILLKPTDSQGSRGITVCGPDDDVEAAFDKARAFSSDGTCLVQKFIKGREFFAEGIAFDGKYENLIVGDTIYFDDNTLFAAKNRIVPSAAPREMVDEVAALNIRIMEGFGLSQGITHSEYIFDEDGPYLIETAARGGGVYISSDLISLTTGLCTEEFLVNIALGTQKGFPDLADTGKVSGYMAFFIPKGKVISTEGIDEVDGLPYVGRSQLYRIHEGMEQTSGPKDKTSRFALIVTGGSRAELEQRMEEIKSMLKIKVDTGSGIEGPVFC